MFVNNLQKSTLQIDVNKSKQNANKKMEEDDNQFLSDDVLKILEDIIEGTLAGSFYDRTKINGWCNKISEMCLNNLSKMKKALKYVVVCQIMPRTGAGLHTAAAFHWDQQTDGQCTVRWENKTIICILTVFGTAI